MKKKFFLLNNKILIKTFRIDKSKVNEEHFFGNISTFITSKTASEYLKLNILTLGDFEVCKSKFRKERLERRDSHI